MKRWLVAKESSFEKLQDHNMAKPVKKKATKKRTTAKAPQAAKAAFRKGVNEMLKNRVPLQRFANPEEIANLVLFISSNKAGFITGSCIIADGGQTISI